MATEMLEQQTSKPRCSQPVAPKSLRTTSFRMARFHKGDDMINNEKEDLSCEAPPPIRVPVRRAGGDVPAEKLQAPAERHYTRCRTIKAGLRRHDDVAQLCTQLVKDIEDSKLMISVLDKMPSECASLHGAAGGGSSAARLIKQQRESPARRTSGGMLRLSANSRDEFSDACTSAPPSFDTLPSLDTLLTDARFVDESDEDDSSDEDMTLEKGKQAQVSVHTKDLDFALSKREVSSTCSTAPPSLDTLPDLDSVPDETDDESASEDESDDGLTLEKMP